ncbi:protein translocase subunit YajC [Acetobacter orientalis]|uniref:Protein translocase subunit YajC n=1 Tax=Acetobacter orientalis TaxID=146474 RepID=A0A2Z5ZFF0_9PROT|nr:protein translocase subunit YajC [Acetobacter orientalis]
MLAAGAKIRPDSPTKKVRNGMQTLDARKPKSMVCSFAGLTSFTLKARLNV